MFCRKILTANLKQDDPRGVVRMSKPDDFASGALQAIGRKSLKGEMVFPCVIDVRRGRTLYARGLDADKLREAPFANVYARNQATSVLSVPWEAGPVNHPCVRAAPLYVFSPGRCGSTLLHSILVAAQIRSVSEPDIAAALISPEYINRPLLRPLLRWATRSFARDLVNALGSDGEPLVVKLRSQFCRAVPSLLKGSRERRTIFMTRQFESWAQSVSQIFTVSPNYLVKEYRRSIICYADLRLSSDCHFLRYESLLAEPYKEMGRLSEFLGREIPGDAIERAMAVRSQAGTRLTGPSEPGIARWNAMREEVCRLWTASGSEAFCEGILREASPGSVFGPLI